ncbi:degenerin-like protein asic-2 isoform X2 [Dreissena polymorpha]|uniref:degenerin-like protein asic-2 isoform X2 n=1 Tax=Dreissena polymorpha TaxID=45954 RepID=UPI002265376D|nr:degenerin-like protein asic-2 isoform X2 [Dreissena polymorpha]
MGKTAVAEYVDYATIHGVERIKNSPFAALKITWLIALCASLGMITWQVVMLYQKYDSHPVSTSIEMKTVKKMKFPTIVICNTNPIQYHSFPYTSPLEDPLNEAAAKYSIDREMFESNDSLFTYNYTDFDKIKVPTDFDADIMVNTAEKFKMRLSNLSESELKEFSQPYDTFVLSCTFAGKSCSQSAIGSDSTFRTYDYGLCFVFDPTKQDGISPSGEVSSSGQRYGLELLLNVDQFESVPFVTSSSGVVIAPLYDVGEYLDANAGVFVPTGFQADIAVSKTVTERVPGKNNESPMCDVISNASVYDCLRQCRQENIALRCGCYQQVYLFNKVKDDTDFNETFDDETRNRACLSDEDYVCIIKALDEFTNSTPSECKCISPCREEVYTQDITLISWPTEKYLPILRRIITAKLQTGNIGFDRNQIRDNFLLVRVYLKTLSYEVIKESYAYEIVNFVSDIGGQLGLWAGFSVLSILEIMELVFLLVTKKDNQTGPEKTGSREKPHAQRKRR